MEDRVKELAEYRYETSIEDLSDAKLMLNLCLMMRLRDYIADITR